MGVTSHDYREMSVEVDLVRGMLQEARDEFPDVRFVYAEAAEAFRRVVYGSTPENQKLELSCELTRRDGSMMLTVDTVNGAVFGPQPFLAVKMRGGRYVHDNLDFDPSLTSWSYTFDRGSIRPEDVEAIGVAANDSYGNTVVEQVAMEGS
jgi:hypothetical protein